MMVPLEVTKGSEEYGSHPLPTLAWVDVFAGCSKERSFLEALQSKPRVEMMRRSSLCMDILQMSPKDAVGIGGDDLRLAVDYYVLEYSGLAAGIAKNTDSVKKRVEELVGFFRFELGRVIAGLDGLPFRK